MDGVSMGCTPFSARLTFGGKRTNACGGEAAVRWTQTPKGSPQFKCDHPHRRDVSGTALLNTDERGYPRMDTDRYEPSDAARDRIRKDAAGFMTGGDICVYPCPFVSIRVF